MANNDPKSLHDRDASAASDPLASYYSHWIKESNGELKSVGMSLLQLTALLGGSTPPTPVSGTFSVVMTGVNTTIASYVGSFTDSYDRHYVSVNDTAAPTAVTDGIAGPASGIVDLGDYNQKMVRMWTGVIDGSAAGITWTQRLSEVNGSAEYPIQATYTALPGVPSNVAITPGSGGSGQVNVTFTPGSSPIGIAQHDLLVTLASDDSQVQYFQDITSGDTFSNLPIGVSLKFTVIVVDNNNRIAESDPPAQATLPAAATFDGTISIRKTSEYREAEDGGTLRIYFDLADHGSTNDVTFDVQTVDDTAVAGVNFTALVDETVTITHGSTSGYVDISLTNTGALAVNKAAQLQIIPGTASGNAVIAAYPNNAAIFYIDGTVAPSSTDRVQAAVSDAGGNANIICLDGSHFDSVDPRGYGTGYYWEAKTSWDATNDLTGYTGDGVATVRATDGAKDFTVAATAFAEAPVASYGVQFTETGEHTIFIRARNRVGWQDRWWVGFNGIDACSPPGTIFQGVANDSYTWTKHPATYNVTAAGRSDFNLIHALKGENVDKIVISDNPDYDPSAVSSGDGPAESGLAPDGLIPDDSSNSTVEFIPVDPTQTNYDPTSFSTDGGEPVQLLDPIIVYWPAGTNSISVDSITEQDGSGNSISGTVSVSTTPSLANRFTWTPSQARAENTTYTITASGTLVDPTGVPRPWSITGTTLQFTSFNSGAASVLLSTNFSGEVAGSLFTKAKIFELWNYSGTAGNAFGNALTNPPAVGFTNDPAGTPSARGIVMRQVWPKDKYAAETDKIETRLNWGTPGYTFDDPQEEVWIAYDIFCDFDRFPKGFKLHGFMADNLGANGENTVPDGNYCSAKIMIYGNDPNNPWGGPATSNIPVNEAVICAYYYNAENWRITQYFGDSDWSPSGQYGTPTPGFFLVPKRKWFRVKMRFKMNTATTTKLKSTGAVKGVDYLADGLLEMYVNAYDGRGMVKRLSRNNVSWRTHKDLKWDRGYYTFFCGGGDSTWRSFEEMNIYHDNFVISTSDPG